MKSRMPLIAAAAAALLLTGCLSKVPPEQRAGDPWRRQAEILSRPTNPD